LFRIGLLVRRFFFVPAELEPHRPKKGDGDGTETAMVHERLRASNHPLSPRRAMALLRQIQKHHVVIDHKNIIGTGHAGPDQRDLFRALNLDVSTENRTL